MSIQLEIPDTITMAMRLPDAERKDRLLTELALALYAQGILSFGKARQLLGKRLIVRHYSQEEFEDDLSYARGK